MIKDKFKKILENKQLKSFLDCSKKPVVHTTLPSNGLCLVNVEYPNIFYKNGEII